MQPNHHETTSHLPEHLLENILVRLPVKSLLRFRCVSKLWNSLITTPQFATSHINHNNATNTTFLVRCYYEETRHDTYTLHSNFNNETLEKSTEIDYPHINTTDFFYILGCVNGLVCLLDSYQRSNTVALWNPSIKKTLTLPKPNYELSMQELMITALGFGFDSLGNDYKVVRIYDRNGRLTMDVFKLSTRCWSDVGLIGSANRVRPNAAVCLNGALHWLGYNHSIVAFDLSRETFAEMALPGELQGVEMDEYDVVAWRGLISVLRVENREKVSLWTMRECGVRESWSKEFVVLTGGFGALGSVGKNGELLFLDSGWRSVNAYDPVSQVIKHDVLQFEVEGRLIRLQMTPYVESLVLLDVGDDLPALPPCEQGHN